MRHNKTARKKEIRLRWLGLSKEQLLNIKSYIEDGLQSQSLQGDEAYEPKAEQEKRQGRRVFLPSPPVQLTIEPSEHWDGQECLGEGVDLSSGGICVRIDQHFKLAKHARIGLKLLFLSPPLEVQGVVLGLQYDD